MSVRFIIGRAGSGKTWRCLEAIRARLRESACEGHRLLLIVPEQASFQMERALIETPDLHGYTRCEVLSFQRLAFRIFSETGAGPRQGDQTIGPLGRLMVLRRLLRRERGTLRMLEGVADKPGTVRQLAATIDELMREEVQPEALASLADRVEATDPLQAARFADIARLYRDYVDYLIEDRIDPAQYLTLAAERIDRCAWLRDAEVWVDGFAGLTAQEYVLLARLARQAASVEMTLLIDPGASVLTRDDAPRFSLSLFSRTERTLLRLRQTFVAEGVSVDEPLRLDMPSPPRFARPELAQLERHLFRTQPGAPIAPSSSAVRVLELPDRRAEVDAAIAEIQRLTREGETPMRYRDIAIVVRDLSAYHDLLAAAMRAHGIPCFIDRRVPTTHHPLIELVRGLLAIAVDDCRLDSVRLTLKTGLLPIETRDADLLENYLIAHALQGAETFAQEWGYCRMFRSHRGQTGPGPAEQAILRRVNAARSTWHASVAGWLTAAREHGALTGGAWAEALATCLELNGVRGRLESWALRAEEDGRSEEADMHRQVWSDFLELLGELVRALGTEPMRPEEFRETFEAGLAEFNLGLAPPTLDQVLVGAIERSRHPAMRAVLVLGFDEGHFPMRRSEDPLLGDAERETLESAGIPVGPPRRRLVLDEQMLAYIAMTRASERLWISYPRATEDGKALQASPYLADLCAALPGLEVEKLGEARAGRRPEWITRVGELGARLAGEFRYRPASEDGAPAVRALWNGLYAGACARRDWHATLKRCLGGLAYRNLAELEQGLVSQAYPEPLQASVSRLERFAACPFSHFVEYGLKLEERREAELSQLDLGTICHTVLEKFINELISEKASLAELGDDEIAARVDRAAGEVIPQLADAALLSDSRNAFQIDRSRGHLDRVTRWQRNAARAGRFRTQAVEAPFGLSDGRMNALSLTTPKGRTILLRGCIDRVDIAELAGQLVGVVIDYKRTDERLLNLGQVYHGLTLQLVGYLLALQQHGRSLTGRPIVPVGAFYLPILEPFRTVAHPDEEKDRSYLYRGIADTAGLPVLDVNVGAGGASQFYSARLRNDGNPHATCDLAHGDQLRAVMRHVGRRMGELADDLLDGNIATVPYRLQRKMPCAYCAYKAVCRYEIETQPPRTLQPMRRGEALQQIASEDRDG